MTTPQNPGRRRREKARRTKQLAAWRAKKTAAQPSHAAETAGAAKAVPATDG